MSKEHVVAQILRDCTQGCFALQPGLFSSDDEAIHRFRLACKRLRFAIERFETGELEATAKALAKITDELGAAHDCVVLAKRARDLNAGTVAWRAQQDRGRHIKRGRQLWLELSGHLEQRPA